MIASLVRIATVLALLCAGAELTGCLPTTAAHVAGGSEPVASDVPPLPIPTLPPLDTILPSI